MSKMHKTPTIAQGIYTVFHYQKKAWLWYAYYYQNLNTYV